MRILDAEALLLDVFDLQERDRIVVFLTAEHGTRRGVARGARTKYSRFAGQLQQLSKVRITWAEKPGRELVRISDVQTLRPAARLQESLEGILVGAYLAEHMTELVQQDDPSSAWYRLLDSAIEALLEGVEPELVGRYVEVWALRLSGVLPVPRECPLCGRAFDGRSVDEDPVDEGSVDEGLVDGNGEPLDVVLVESEGALVCVDCAEGQRGLRVDRGELAFLRRTGRMSLRQMAEDPPPPVVLDRVEQLCAKIRRHFLQKELRSYGVMRKALAS